MISRPLRAAPQLATRSLSAQRSQSKTLIAMMELDVVGWAESVVWPAQESTRCRYGIVLAYA